MAEHLEVGEVGEKSLRVGGMGKELKGGGTQRRFSLGHAS